MKRLRETGTLAAFLAPLPACTQTLADPAGSGMLLGAFNWCHDAVVIIGCFILLGAASIVAGICTAATRV